MSTKQGRGVVVKNKLRILKRNYTMHIDYIAPKNESPQPFISVAKEAFFFQQIIPRNESSQSLESESGMDNDSTGTSREISDAVGTSGRPLEYSVRDPEQVEAILRRGRRRAIIDEKNLIGDSESESQDGTSTGAPAAKGVDSISADSSSMVARVNVFRERQQRMLRKQHTIADLNTRIQTTINPQEFDSKRRQNVFMKLIERRSRSKESLLELSEALQRLTPSLFQDHYLESYRVSHTLCRELISNLTRDAKNKEFGSTDVLLRPLKRWSEHSKDGEVYHSYCLNYDSALSYLDSLRKVDHFNEFEKASSNLEYSALDLSFFFKYLKWCEQDPRCRRLQLTDLLVAPMQHYMKIPLLLASIRRYTADVSEREILTSCVNKVENSLKSLEDKMRWLKNFERLQEIQSQLIWPSISEMEPRVFIPEFLRQSMSRQPCERLIANPKRQLLHEGFLTFSGEQLDKLTLSDFSFGFNKHCCAPTLFVKTDGSKIVEIFAFLFDDFLLITRIKKQPKKKSFSENTLNSRSLTEGGIFIVYRQAIALDRFTIHDLGLAEANGKFTNGLRHAFVLVLITRFQQITGVYTLQATNELDKIRWIEKLRQSQQLFQEKLKQKLYGIDSDHQTNKHSKVLLNKHKTHFGPTMDEEPTIGRELYTSIPSRASSASPSSMHRTKAASSEIPELAEEEQTTRPASVALPAVHIEAFLRKESKCSKCPENVFSINDEPQKSSTCLSLNRVDETNIGVIGKGSQSKPLVYFTEHMDKSRPVSDNSLLSAIETGTTKQRLFEDHFVDIAASLKKEHPMSTESPVQSTSAPMLMKHLPETKVEFFYSPTGQSPFSPPLSPILHPPCASLPSAVTLPDSYDNSSSRFHDELEHRMNRLRMDQEKSKPTDQTMQHVSSNKPN
ncbi:Pleckstrin domain-containing family G member 7 [Fasciola gigantica]|uniref:Pleckstrin domain-containing family G member 7 n=1 Tax=Fasciola gigantica TaxID=46835 RepID=A0A504YRW1_FASGI|nr:Pleckstrin domain-containing family G member 7 [Fasciola gigantica]